MSVNDLVQAQIRKDFVQADDPTGVVKAEVDGIAWRWVRRPVFPPYGITDEKTDTGFVTDKEPVTLQSMCQVYAHSITYADIISEWCQEVVKATAAKRAVPDLVLLAKRRTGKTTSLLHIPLVFCKASVPMVFGMDFRLEDEFKGLLDRKSIQYSSKSHAYTLPNKVQVVFQEGWTRRTRATDHVDVVLLDECLQANQKALVQRAFPLVMFTSATDTFPSDAVRTRFPGL